MTFPLPTSVPPSLRFLRRLLDSAQIKDFPSGVRTLRGRQAVLDAERGRVYAWIGSGVGVYPLSDLLSRLDEPMIPVAQTLPLAQRTMWDGTMWEPIEGEYWHPPQSFWHSEEWLRRAGDGQDRVFAVSLSDDGTLWVAGGPYGWGQAWGPNVYDLPQTGVVPTEIITLKSGGKYYALVANFQAQDVAQLYDITDPSNIGPAIPSGVRPALGWSKAVGPDGNSVVAIIQHDGIGFYEVSGLIGLRPVMSSALRPACITSDGTTFYTAKNGGEIARLSWVGPGYASGWLGQSTLTPQRIRHGAGYLTVMGTNAAGLWDVEIFRLRADGLERIECGDFFSRTYRPMPGVGTYVNLFHGDCLAFRHGDRDLLWLSAYGICDLYELAPSGAPWTHDPEPPDPKPPDPKPPVVDPPVEPPVDPKPPEPPEPTCPPPPRYMQVAADKDIVVVGEEVWFHLSVFQGRLEACHAVRWEIYFQIEQGVSAPDGWALNFSDAKPHPHTLLKSFEKSGNYKVWAMVSDGVHEFAAYPLTVTVKEKFVAIATPSGRQRGAKRG